MNKAGWLRLDRQFTIREKWRSFVKVVMDLPVL